MQATKTRGLTNREHGESKRSGGQPTGNASPATEYFPAYLGDKLPSAPGQRPGSSEPPRQVSLTSLPKGEGTPPGVPCLGAGCRKERLGSGGNRPLPSLVESITVNVGGFRRDAKGSESTEALAGSPRVSEASEAP